MRFPAALFLLGPISGKPIRRGFLKATPRLKQALVFGEPFEPNLEIVNYFWPTNFMR